MDLTAEFCDRIRAAQAQHQPLELRGGGSKRFYGRPATGHPLELGGHRGILSYQPTELVVRARAGTPLAELEAALAERGQMLPFEPPYFGGEPTIGGAIASGLAGPRRPWGGAPRDLLLGVRILDGRGQVLGFGGQVMKNVAGYDLSRLMAGAMGTLGILLEVSVKVLPKPPGETTLALTTDPRQALALMGTLQRQSLSLSGLCFAEGRLHVRASDTSLEQVRAVLGPAATEEDPDFWHRLRDQTLDFFTRTDALWRASVPAATAPLAADGDEILDWGGAQRWLRGVGSRENLRQSVQAVGGHATMFRGPDRDQALHPLAPALAGLHQRIKAVFDPERVLNPGRLYPGL
jgi:glycolate oxidase FAD binding subunit